MDKKENITLYEALKEIQQDFSQEQKNKFKNEIIKLILNRGEKNE